MRSRPSPTPWLLAVLLLAAPGAPAAPDEPTRGTTVGVRLADGFDFPVGKPEAVGYHKARGFTPNGHLGEDWDGDRGGNTDLGDPVYATGHGVVVLAGNMHMGWGNVVMVRHCYREAEEGGAVRTVDSLYGHLDTILVREGQAVTRGQQVGTIGTAFGLYEAHLHFEIRKNVAIGMFRSSFARDFSNYHDPTAFIQARRRLSGNTLVAVNTFTPTPATGLKPADGAYELGINRSPAKVAEMESSHLAKSAFDIKPRPKPTPGKVGGNSFREDPYSDLREENKW